MLSVEGCKYLGYWAWHEQVCVCADKQTYICGWAYIQGSTSGRDDAFVLYVVHSNLTVLMRLLKQLHAAKMKSGGIAQLDV